MPSSLEAIVVLIFAIVPGFLTVKVIQSFRPVRTQTHIDAVAWSVLYSLIVNCVVLFSASLFAIRCYDFDPKPLIEGGWQWTRDWATAKPITAEVVALCYLVASAFVAWLLGVIISRVTDDLTPVWYLETLNRVSKWGLRRRAHVARCQ